MIRASVAMAVYNGEKHIHQQIDTILSQLTEEDELVISYDRSTDATWDIIQGYAQQDSRVRVVENPYGGGVQNNFTSAVMSCRGQYIFLADQDDVWYQDKIAKVVDVFETTDADLVVHDGYMADADLNILEGTIFQRFGTYNNPLLNIVKQNFWGCCMAFRWPVRELVCPFPNKGKVGHDIWIGILVGFSGKIVRIPECLIAHRLHGSNVSAEKTRPLPEVLKHRLWLLHFLIKKGWSLLWKSGRGETHEEKPL